MRGATLNTNGSSSTSVISIHAPLAGSDLTVTSAAPKRRYFDPRSPCGERPEPCQHNHPAWYFDPRSPCGERPLYVCLPHLPVTISIHAPLAGSDVAKNLPMRLSSKFRSTLPLRGATAFADVSACCVDISIHAPLAGSDSMSASLRAYCQNFDPRSPCGERLKRRIGRPLRPTISIHAPLAGSDVGIGMIEITSIAISIHAPLAGSDRIRLNWTVKPVISIHAPLAGSDWQFIYLRRTAEISIHAPLAGSDYATPPNPSLADISIHAPLAGSDPMLPLRRGDVGDFDPRSPCGERLRQRRSRSMSRIFRSTLPLRGATNAVTGDTCWMITFRSTLPLRGATTTI